LPAGRAINSKLLSGGPRYFLQPEEILGRIGEYPSSSALGCVAFAGFTPGFVGLYQINFQVPAGAHSGEVELDVMQNGVAANPTLLPVSP
jgi:hypothetical protein